MPMINNATIRSQEIDPPMKKTSLILGNLHGPTAATQSGCTFRNLRMTSSFRNVLAMAFLLVVTGLGLTVSSYGAPVTFAQFDETSGGGPFSFINNNTSATFSGTTLGNFNFLVPGVSNGPQAATITLSSSAVTPAEAGFGLLFQPIDGATNTLSFTRVSDGANLLTVTFRSGIVGFDGDASASINGNSASGDTVMFTSDFLNFSGTGDRSMLVTLSAINPSFTQDPDGFLESFTTDLGGGFSSLLAPTAVPDHGATLPLLGLGTIGLLALRRRFRAA